MSQAPAPAIAIVAPLIVAVTAANGRRGVFASVKRARYWANKVADGTPYEAIPQRME